MNNWKAVGYIFLGFGSVFLGYALIAFAYLFSLVHIVLIALVANGPWFILAALTYVVGFVGYFAGRENSAIIEGPNEEETQDFEEEYTSHKFDPLWSIVIGAVVTIALLVLTGVMGIWNDFDLTYGVALPFLCSIVAGSAVGYSAFYFINKVNRS